LPDFSLSKHAKRGKKITDGGAPCGLLLTKSGARAKCSKARCPPKIVEFRFGHFGALNIGVSDILVSYILVFGNFSFRTFWRFEHKCFGHFSLIHFGTFWFSDILPRRLKSAFVPSAVFFVSEG
jgi:hypothetical protein